MPRSIIRCQAVLVQSFRRWTDLHSGRFYNKGKLMAGAVHCSDWREMYVYS